MTKIVFLAVRMNTKIPSGDIFMYDKQDMDFSYM
jgi:hypothetical protein